MKVMSDKQYDQISDRITTFTKQTNLGIKESKLVLKMINKGGIKIPEWQLVIIER